MRRAWLPLVVLAAAAAAQERPPPPVVVAPVLEQEVAARRSFVGTVEAARRSTVGSEVEGVIVEYLAREGDRVVKGQPLAKLRTRLLEIRLGAARAELELRRQELAELRNGSRPEEIEAARAKVGQARAGLDVQEWKLSAAQRLFESDTISEDALKDARLSARVAEEKLKEEQANLKLVEAGPREERILQAAARVQVQEGEVARLVDDLERHTIRAPFDGYVVGEHTEVGQWLGRGDAVADVAALDQVDVTVPVLEDYVAALKTKTRVPVTVDALPGRSLTGVLDAIVPSADLRARTFPVKIRLDNVAQNGSVLIKAGMFARVHLDIGDKKKALLVPKDAVVLGGPQPVVYVADARSGAVRMVPVTLGLAVDSRIEVSGGLAANELVVVRGNERLHGASRVQITETVK